MNLPFIKSHSAIVKCRHCGSSDIRISRRSSGSTSHATYRCEACKRHFRAQIERPAKQGLIAATSFLALLLISAGSFLYLASDHETEDPPIMSYQPTVDMQNQGALEKIQNAARQGSPQAQYNLGSAYWQRGEYLKALPWIKAAAGQGHTEAEYMLGMAYLEGHGTVQNYRFALEQFTRAAQHAHLEAQYRLGLFYRDGLATPPSKENAYIWLNIAAARGHDDALQYRDKLTAAMSTDEINRAQEASTHTLAKLSNVAAGRP